MTDCAASPVLPSCTGVAYVVGNTDLMSAFVGSSDADIQYPDVASWSSLSSRSDAWGRSAVELDVAARGWCTANGCDTWSWQVAAGQSLHNRSRDGISVNDPFVPNESCPGAVDGNVAIADYWGNTFLLNAVEVLSDGLGDDDGLCESAEQCTYSANFGAFQGDVDASLNTEYCDFNNGLVVDVKMLGHSASGQ